MVATMFCIDFTSSFVFTAMRTDTTMNDNILIFTIKFTIFTIITIIII